MLVALVAVVSVMFGTTTWTCWIYLRRRETLSTSSTIGVVQILEICVVALALAGVVQVTLMPGVETSTERESENPPHVLRGDDVVPAARSNEAPASFSVTRPVGIFSGRPATHHWIHVRSSEIDEVIPEIPLCAGSRDVFVEGGLHSTGSTNARYRVTFTYCCDAQCDFVQRSYTVPVERSRWIRACEVNRYFLIPFLIVFALARGVWRRRSIRPWRRSISVAALLAAINIAALLLGSTRYTVGYVAGHWSPVPIAPEATSKRMGTKRMGTIVE